MSRINFKIYKKILNIQTLYSMSQKQTELTEIVKAQLNKQQNEIENIESEQRQIEEVQKVEQDQIEELPIQKSEIKQQGKVESQKKEVVYNIQSTHVQPPPINNPKYSYKGDQKYSWDIQFLDNNACLEKIQAKTMPDFHQFLYLNQVNIEIAQVNNLKGHLFYHLKVNDRKGEREFSRRYTQFNLLRSKITQLWPGIMFATLPDKTLIGVSEAELIRRRSRYISRFLRTLSKHESIYYSQESQTFLNNSQDTNISTYLQAIPTPKSVQIFQKYKTSFSQEYRSSTRQDFLYRKDQISGILEAYQAHFSKKKIELAEYLGALRRMAESKQKYFKAASKLNLNLLADYEDTLYRWIYGEPLPKNPPSIMERMSLKKIVGKESQAQKKAENEVKQSQKQQEVIKFGLYSSQPYMSRFQDTAQSIKDYNSSSWKIYEVVKFELKEIDSVIGAIQQLKSVGREINHHKRTININKEQIEALNSNKKTLKTLFMDGNTDEKKMKLTNQNQAIQDQLQRLQQYYNLLLFLLQTQLKKYHKQRISFYKFSLSKAFNEELQICKAIMNFHAFEEQLFAKELQQRKSMMQENNDPSNKVAEQQCNDHDGN